MVIRLFECCFGDTDGCDAVARWRRNKDTCEAARARLVVEGTLPAGYQVAVCLFCFSG